MALSEAERLESLVAGQLASACNWPDEQRDSLLQRIHQRYGTGVAAVLVYGSYLRGKRDTLLDFYVLVDNYAAMGSRWQSGLAWLLSPNVYQVSTGQPPHDLRAKYALITLARFEHAMQHDFHSYFWARFVQPCGLLYCRDEAGRERLVRSIAQAARTFVTRVVPILPKEFTVEELVREGLSMTYGCELRSEPAGHAEALFSHNAAYYLSMAETLVTPGSAFHSTGRAGLFRNDSSLADKRRAAVSWRLRRLQGKLLSVLRLLKAALTFDGGFDYVLWKIGRHSGIYIEPTDRQRKYPLLFGWPLLWRLYRRGAFR